MLYIHTGELSDQWSSKHWKGGKCCHKHATQLLFHAWFRWNHPPPTCGQLFRPEQAIPGVEGVGWAEQRDWILIHGCRAHKNSHQIGTLVGTRKFSPDWRFGLLKRAFRRSKVGCLDNIVCVVESSATVNYVQLVASQDGRVIVPTYDWASCLAPFFVSNPFRGINVLHHLCFLGSQPGLAIVRELADSLPRELRVTKDEGWQPSAESLPPVIPPQGLSFEKIREFCPEECRDIVCPDPSSSTPSEVEAPSPKRQRSL